jgi:pyruvate formate lyase activating enzyme
MLGGEPTIHKNFYKIVKRVKALGLKVGVHTNGTNPGALKKLVKEKLVDYFAMDIKAPLERYKEIVGVDTNPIFIIESINVIKSSQVDYEFRTTVVPGLLGKEDIEKISRLISGSKRFFIQQFQPGKTLNFKYSKIKPYRISELAEFKKIAEPFINKVDIRGA